MIKSRKQMFMIIGVFTLVMLLGTVTYAFFNYTRIGSSNTIRVGNISFNSSQTVLNLQNAFPISSSSLLTDVNNHDTTTITITGKTTYSDGIEYKVTLEDVNNTINEKQVPISFKVDVNNLGTNSNDYWNQRGGSNNIYEIIESGKVMDDKYIVVGYIKPDMVGVNGTIEITAYIDENTIAVTDTIENGDIEVSGYENNTSTDWINGRVVLTTSEWNSISTNPLSFKVKVEANEGVWVEREKYAIDFIKDNIISNVNINFNDISSNNNENGVYELDGTNDYANPIYFYRGDVDDNNVVFAGFCWQIIRTTETSGIKMIYNGEATNTNGVYTCNNTNANDRIILTNSFSKNAKIDSLAYHGYMYNNVYEIKNESLVSGAKFSSSFNYDNGLYTLNMVDESLTSPNATHHYTCNLALSNGQCSTIRYYYASGYYIELTNGKSIEDTLNEMLSDDNVNTNSSQIMEDLENWFEDSLDVTITGTNKKYSDFLEDTIWCNNRDITLGIANSGWNPNGGSLGSMLYFDSALKDYTSSAPNLNCSRKINQFRVNNNKAQINYPVGLITNEEVILAGGKMGVQNVNYYLYIGTGYWTMTPYYFYPSYPVEFIVDSKGKLGGQHLDLSRGVRPVISLKSGVKFSISGDGTNNNPYQVIYG